jgi:hypothetical protein
MFVGPEMATNEICIQYGRQLHYFQFTSIEFYEDFQEFVEDTVKNVLNTFQEMLINKFPSDKNTIEHQIQLLQDLFMKKAEEPLHKFKETCDKIFTLPTNILLPSHDPAVASEELDQLKKEVYNLEQEYIEEIYYKAILNREVEKFEHIRPLYEKTNEVLKNVKNMQCKPGEKSLRELFQALATCEEWYLNESNGHDADKFNVVDHFHLFKREDCAV